MAWAMAGFPRVRVGMRISWPVCESTGEEELPIEVFPEDEACGILETAWSRFGAKKGHAD